MRKPRTVAAELKHYRWKIKNQLHLLRSLYANLCNYRRGPRNDALPPELASDILPAFYPQGDYHRLFYGEIMRAWAARV